MSPLRASQKANVKRWAFVACCNQQPHAIVIVKCFFYVRWIDGLDPVDESGKWIKSSLNPFFFKQSGCALGSGTVTTHLVAGAVPRRVGTQTDSSMVPDQSGPSTGILTRVFHARPS